jgi:hypothetical protein
VPHPHLLNITNIEKRRRHRDEAAGGEEREQHLIYI